MTSCNVTINHVEEGLWQRTLTYFPSNISLKRRKKTSQASSCFKQKTVALLTKHIGQDIAFYFDT